MTPPQSRHDLGRTRPWMREGTALFLNAVEQLDDEQLRAPSGLPTWSRDQLVAHVARNAEALSRLASWARTGVETPMYSSFEQRDADIAAARQSPASLLRSELVATAIELERDLDGLSASSWSARVRSAMGREIPATELPWMRVREVWMHAVDLASGVSVEDLPDALLDTLADDVSTMLSTREGCPALRLEPRDREVAWVLGPSAQDAAIVRGTAGQLVAWMTGRDSGQDLSVDDGDGLPVLPRWL